MAFNFSAYTPTVERVTADGQAEALGVQVGWLITKINNAAYTKDRRQAAGNGTMDYQMTFIKVTTSR